METAKDQKVRELKEKLGHATSAVAELRQLGLLVEVTVRNPDQPFKAYAEFRVWKEA